MRTHRVVIALAAAVAVCPVAWGQAAQQAQLRALNAQVLQLRGALASANASQQAAIHSQAATALTQRQSVAAFPVARGAKPARAKA